MTLTDTKRKPRHISINQDNKTYILSTGNIISNNIMPLKRRDQHTADYDCIELPPTDNESANHQ